MIGDANLGGGIGKAFAAVSVTYPAGSVCTCSNGAKTLKAKDTSGRFLFLIPEAGVWTVTAADGTDTASSTVNITEEDQGKAFSLHISYRLYLYKDGDLCTDVTGGWMTKAWKHGSSTANAKAPTVTYNADTVDWTISKGGGAWITNNRVDLTNYAQFVIEFESTSGYANSMRGAVIETQGTYYDASSTAWTSFGNLTDGKLIVDISAVNKVCYAAICGSNMNETLSITGIRRIYLVPKTS